MRVPYSKMHGTGNQILVVDQRSGQADPPDEKTLQFLGNDATGPGFDQLMWIGASDDGRSVASYRVFNADGSEVEQCGNGVRCVARYLAGKDELDPTFSLQSPAGPIAAELFADGQVAVSMGEPEFSPAAIPFVAENEALTYPLLVSGEQLLICAVSMGNPHAVLQVDDVELAAVSETGPRIETHERFPAFTNVGFMQITGPDSIKLRVHERGVGETAACGTGACAAVVSGIRLGLLDDEVTVQLPGGQVVVSWRGESAPVWLKGNAVLINEGTMDLKE